ncbi:MAG: acyltransferase [Succinivibrionaceae bacterium]|nr:acyltransferase [Succinivibrionaceae bacterium]
MTNQSTDEVALSKNAMPSGQQTPSGDVQTTAKNDAKKTRPKFNEITLLKMLALASVLFFHCYRPFLGEGAFWKVVLETTDESFSSFFGTLYHFNKVFDVHCLFFCSGFLYFMTMSGGKRTVGEQLARRVKRIVVPYFSVGLLFTVPLYVLFHIPSGKLLSTMSLTDAYGLFLTMNFSDHLWFLQIMLLITVICLLLNFMIRKYFLVLLAGSLLMTFVFNRVFDGITTMSLVSMSDNLFLFVLGGAVFRYYRQFTTSLRYPILAVSGALFFTTFNLTGLAGLAKEINSVACDASACVFALGLARFVADGTMNFLYRFRAIQYYDRNFMGFYMYHMPIPLICAYHLYPAMRELVASDWLYVVAAWLVTILLTAVAVRVASLIKAVCTRAPLIQKLYN